MRTLVTGGAGFIGANYIARLLRVHPEDEVVCLDALTYAGRCESLRGVFGNPAFSFVRADITDRAAVAGVFRGQRFDAVVNFAAESHVDRSISDPGRCVRTNVEGTQVLLDACRAFGVPRFHQVSTDEVYGGLPLSSQCRFGEDAPLSPSSPYAASKAAADLLALAARRTHGLHVTISRGSNTYGPFQFPEKLIPLTIARAAEGKPIPIYGSGLQRRDWLYVEDHCDAVDRIVRGGGAGEIFHVASHEERSNLDVVREILWRMGRDESLLSFVDDRPGHDQRYGLRTEKLRDTFHWQPRMGFSRGLAQTVAWYCGPGAFWRTLR